MQEISWEQEKDETCNQSRRQPQCVAKTTKLEISCIKVMREIEMLTRGNTASRLVDVTAPLMSGSPPRTKELGRMMRRHIKKNMEILSGVDTCNHQWQRRVCCKDHCYFNLLFIYRTLS